MGQDSSEVRREVEAARDQLGATVEAIAYRANSPKRAKDRMAARLSDLKNRLTPHSGGR